HDACDRAFRARASTGGKAGTARRTLSIINRRVPGSNRRPNLARVQLASFDTGSVLHSARVACWKAADPRAPSAGTIESKIRTKGDIRIKLVIVEPFDL